MSIHDKINSRSYVTTHLGFYRLLVPYVTSFIYDRPRFYFNSDKKTIFNFKF